MGWEIFNFHPEGPYTLHALIRTSALSMMSSIGAAAHKRVACRVNVRQERSVLITHLISS